jgi:hypothetical protein
MATARRAVEVQNPAQPALPLKKIAKQPTTIEEWVKAKGLYPSYFQVTPEGDLISPPTRDSEQQKIIVVPRMTPKSAEQTQDFFKERREALKEPAEQYAAAKRALQQMMIVYKASPGTVSDNDILIANQQVHDAECILNGLRNMPRSLIVLNEEGDPDTIYTLKDLTLKRHETDRIWDPILQLKTTEYPLEAFWIEAPIPQLEQAQPAPAAADLEAQEAAEEAAPKRPSKPLSAAAIASIKKARAARAAAAAV